MGLNQKQSSNSLKDGLTIGINQIEKTNIDPVADFDFGKRIPAIEEKFSVEVETHPLAVFLTVTL